MTEIRIKLVFVMDPVYLRFSEVLVGALVGGEATLVLNIRSDDTGLPLVCTGLRTLLLGLPWSKAQATFFDVGQSKEERKQQGLQVALEVACILQSWDEWSAFLQLPLSEPLPVLALLFLLWLKYDPDIKVDLAARIFEEALQVNPSKWTQQVRYVQDLVRETNAKDQPSLCTSEELKRDPLWKAIQDKILKDPAWQATVSPFVTLRSLDITSSDHHSLLTRAVQPHYVPGGDFSIDRFI